MIHLDDLDPEFLEAAAIAEAYGDDVLQVLAEDWTRDHMTRGEIAHRQQLAGIAPAPVLHLPLRTGEDPLLRSAA